MAKVKVYSRFPSPMRFEFGGGYVKSENGGVEAIMSEDEDVVVLNGVTEVVNHTLIVKEGAVTIFGYSEHNLAERKYTHDDFERLKAHPVFQKMLKNGDVSIDTMEDLSRDATGVGKLTEKELKERFDKQKSPDGESMMIVTHS